jgi:hypothetical protein
VQWIEEKAVLQEKRDWQFEQCVESFPESPTCTARVLSSDDEEQSSIDCRMQYQDNQIAREEVVDGRLVQFTRDCGFELDSMYAQNPAGLADPITIELGMQLWDMWLF